MVVFYYKTELLASRSTSRCTYEICMGPFERNQTEPIWYVSNERNQTLRSPFRPETGPDCPSGANPNRAVDTQKSHPIQTADTHCRTGYGTRMHNRRMMRRPKVYHPGKAGCTITQAQLMHILRQTTMQSPTLQYLGA